jgi:uncharacterized protein YndB with AHSA1/START domain
MTTTMSSDRIERQVFLKASRSRVWRALTDSSQFGEWFGIRANAAFTAGACVRAEVTHPQHKGLTFDMLIEELVPEQLFSWRWHPNAIEGTRDYSAEPTTLVVFRLEDAPGGTLVKVVESGFDGVPPERRLDAYRGNQQGWDYQMTAIEKYVSQN